MPIGKKNIPSQILIINQTQKYAIYRSQKQNTQNLDKKTKKVKNAAQKDMNIIVYVGRFLILYCMTLEKQQSLFFVFINSVTSF